MQFLIKWLNASWAVWNELSRPFFLCHSSTFYPNPINYVVAL